MLTKLAGNILQVQFIEPGVCYHNLISFYSANNIVAFKCDTCSSQIQLHKKRKAADKNNFAAGHI